jgi:hypothetical protein
LQARLEVWRGQNAVLFLDEGDREQRRVVLAGAKA